MKKLPMIAGLLSFLLIAPYAVAEDGFFNWLISFKPMKEIEVVKDATYEKECGACHFPYQPGLLPMASWKKLLDAKALEDHFGDSAELDEKDRLHILELTTSHAADDSWYKRSRKIMATLDEGEAPLRITETYFFKEKHEDISEKSVKENPKIKSFSACQKCHQKINEGVFDDDTVVIPGQER